jgi:PAS domain S-box-containing protein
MIEVFGAICMTSTATNAPKVPVPRQILGTTLYVLEIAVVALIYVGLANTAALFPVLNAIGTPLWPPSGLALAIMLLRGYRTWPAVFIGSFAANAISVGPVEIQSLAIAGGTTLGGLLGTRLINYWSGGTKTFSNPRGVAKFVLIAFIPTALISAVAASVSSLFADEFNYSTLLASASLWWPADAAASIATAPVILLWATPPLLGVSKTDLLKTAAIVVAAGAIAAVAFSPVAIGAFINVLPHRALFAFLILLPLMWAVAGGNPRAAATAALVFCGFASWEVLGSTRSGSPDLNESPFLLLAISVGISAAPLYLSTMVLVSRQKQARLLSECSELRVSLEQSQVAFKSLKRHYQIFVDSVSDHAVFLLNASGHVASWNKTAQQIIGYNAEEIVGKHFSVLYRPDERRAGEPNRALELASRKGKCEVEGWRIRKNGTPLFVTGVLTAIRDDNRRLSGFASVIRDATERRDTQEQLVEAREQLAMAQKMEAIGKLTGGIAHDFNNLLMIIGGSAQLFKRLLDPKLPRAIEAIQTAAKRGEGLTRQLLTFSRRQHLNPTVIDPNSSIKNMRTMIESSLRGNIIYREKLAPHLWPVKVDLAELELAIVNLAVNARDAMPNGGVFTLSAANVTTKNESEDSQSAVNLVAIEFGDSGTGIPPNLLSKIFDPFFTTKEVGKGSGLGLSQVYGFAHQAGGTVRAESKVGLGTAITMYLPAYAGAEVDAPEPTETDTDRAQRPMVLVVDDSPEVADVTSSLFEHLGYDTIYRESAEAALKLLADGNKVDLVFSDIVMPGTIDGVGLASEVQSRYPHLPVILTTGYSDAAATAPPNLPILRKPFDVDALRNCIQGMIGGGTLQ